MVTVEKIPGRFLTIQAAVNAIGPGSEILIQLVNSTHVENRVQVNDGRKVTIESGRNERVTWTGDDPGVWGLLEVRSKSSVTLKNINLTSNRVTRGIWAENCTLALYSCLIYDNSRQSYAGVGGFGAGMECRRCTVTIDNCEIKDNLIHSGGAQVGCYGGGLFFSDKCTVTITNSSIHNNKIVNGSLPTLAGFGGGVFFETSDITLTDTQIYNNVAGAGDAKGGGVYLSNINSAQFTRCSIILNSVTGLPANKKISVGGGISFDNSDYKCKFISTTIKDNKNDNETDFFCITF